MESCELGSPRKRCYGTQAARADILHSRIRSLQARNYGKPEAARHPVGTAHLRYPLCMWLSPDTNRHPT